jgi:hypothetical protein
MLAMGALATASLAKETRTRMANLPAPVRQTIQTQYPGAKILGLTREKEKGVVLYEAEMKFNGHRVDALLEANGSVRQEETTIDRKELPSAVQSAFTASRHAAGTVVRVERVSTAAQPDGPRYEMQVREGRNRFELVYWEDGHLERETKISKED